VLLKMAEPRKFRGSFLFGSTVHFGLWVNRAPGGGGGYGRAGYWGGYGYGRR
jgi:hypothetical protein